MKLNDLFWVAGFLEGEGSFGFVEKKKYPGHFDIRLSAGQKQREPLERLQSFFGGSIYDYDRIKRGKEISYWTLQGRKAIAVMMTLWPLMSPRRKLQIENTITKWKMNTPRNYFGTANPAAKLTDDQITGILASSEPGVSLAKRYLVSKARISQIRKKARCNAQGYTGT